MKKDINESGQVNLLKLIPARVAEFETREDGLVTILKPKFKKGLMKKLLEPRVKDKHFKIDLDDIGSSVWLLCDGINTVEEIGDAMREKFGEKIEPCYDRLSLFFTHLEASGFVRFSNLEEVKKSES